MLCTIYNYVDSKGLNNKLNTHKIAWLKSSNIDNILPADVLNKMAAAAQQKYLKENPEWGAYFKKNGRYDEKTGKFEYKDNLVKTIKDPYALSSSYLQIANGSLQATNRYNEKIVEGMSKANTAFDNNLDNIMPGLQKAIYSEMGIAYNPTVELAEGFFSHD